MQIQSVVMIGAGNVATHLAQALKKAGYSITAICARSESSTQSLARLIGQEVQQVTDIARLPIADLYILAVSDNAISELATRWPKHCRRGTVVHTSGSVAMETLNGVGEHYGVLYPLQTFSKERSLDFSQVPCFVEGNSRETEQNLLLLAQKLSAKVQLLSSELREKLHLAAVFAGNFTNHLYDLASQLTEKYGLSPDFLAPLLEETIAKAISLTPHIAQTGPARRGDQNVLDKHLALLHDNPKMQILYQLLSDSIYNSYRPK